MILEENSKTERYENVRHFKKSLLCTSFLLITIFIGGHGFINKNDSKETEIKKSFNKKLNMYPVKDLEDLYDKEGYRDGEFDKNDKGTWVIASSVNIQQKGEGLKTRQMALFMNRNIRTSEGRFVITKAKEKSDIELQTRKKEYPVKLIDNKFIPSKQIKDEKTKKETENFEFFSQYGNSRDLKDYKSGEVSHNPNAPNYSAEYQLSNNDCSVKQIRKRCDIPTEQAPKLLLKGTGGLKGLFTGSKSIEFTFVERKGENIYLTNSAKYTPSEQEKLKILSSILIRNRTDETNTFVSSIFCVNNSISTITLNIALDI